MIMFVVNNDAMYTRNVQLCTFWTSGNMEYTTNVSSKNGEDVRKHTDLNIEKLGCFKQMIAS